MTLTSLSHRAGQPVTALYPASLVCEVLTGHRVVSVLAQESFFVIGPLPACSLARMEASRGKLCCSFTVMTRTVERISGRLSDAVSSPRFAGEVDCGIPVGVRFRQPL